MEEIACILCGEFNENVAIEENGFLGRKCHNCELIYISPRPSFSEILDLYGHDDAHISASAHISSSPAKQLHAKQTFKALQRHKQNGKILEIGAGSGYFLQHAQRHGFEPYAIEFNPIQAAYIRDHHNIPCAEVAASAYPFGKGIFDVLYHCDVTSHFFDPQEDFSAMYESLVPGGLMIFETGNLGETDPKFFKHINSFMYPDHLFFFGVRSLVKLLEKNGFKLLSTKRYSLTPTFTFFEAMSRVKRAILRASSIRVNAGNRTKDENVAKKGAPAPSKEPTQTFWMTIRHFLRYSIGAVTPKKGRPQTIVMIAMKR